MINISAAVGIPAGEVDLRRWSWFTTHAALFTDGMNSVASVFKAKVHILECLVTASFPKISVVCGIISDITP